MDREAITRGVIRSLVDRILKEAENDPERTLRKLVDLGGQFVKGRFKSYFFDMVQTMLEDENSAYYDLARRATTQVDREAWETIGVCVGYDSCTLGARIIREQSAACGFDIPWAVMFRLKRDAQFPQEEYDRLIREGIELGIHSYIFYAEEDGSNTELPLELAAAYPHCAFLLAMPAGMVTAEFTSKLCDLPNLVAAPDSQDAEFLTAAKRLHRARLPYACHRKYESEEDWADIGSGAWARQAVDAGCMFAFAHAGEGCSDEICDRVAHYLQEARRDQRDAVILSNYYTDHLFIDRVISGEPCFLSVLSDGTAADCDGRREVPTGVKCAGRSMKEILKTLHDRRSGV